MPNTGCNENETDEDDAEYYGDWTEDTAFAIVDRLLCIDMCGRWPGIVGHHLCHDDGAFIKAAAVAIYMNISKLRTAIVHWMPALPLTVSCREPSLHSVQWKPLIVAGKLLDHVATAAPPERVERRFS